MRSLKLQSCTRSLSVGQIENIFSMLPASMYCKGVKGEYLEVNPFFLRVASNKNDSEVLNKTDHDLIWHQQSAEMMQNDREVFYSGKPKVVFEDALSLGQLRKYVSHKIPLQNNNGKTIGVFGLSFLLENSSMFSEWLQAARIPVSLPANSFSKLTSRQKDCLYYLVLGMTYKQIGKKLNISPKTVENHFVVIKEKLHSHSRAELINEALKMEFIQIRLKFPTH